MPELKLARLPDRTPAKITITVPSDLNRALNDYADIYRETYGEAETVAELIPFMLAAFLESDRGFAKARKSGGRDGEAPFQRQQAHGAILGTATRTVPISQSHAG